MTPTRRMITPHQGMLSQGRAKTVRPRRRALVSTVRLAGCDPGTLSDAIRMLPFLHIIPARGYNDRALCLQHSCVSHSLALPPGFKRLGGTQMTGSHVPAP